MPKKVPYDINSFTKEGAYEVAMTVMYSSTTALKIKVNELLAVLQTKTNIDEKFFDCMLQAFDGVFEKRNIKSEETEEPATDVGVSVLMMSDPTNLTGKLKDSILLRESRGDARRFITSFDADKTIEFVNINLEENQEINNKLKVLGKNFFDDFNQIVIGSTFILTSEAYNTLKLYEKQCFDKAKNIENPHLLIELHSRANKAIRLSCHYAALNHPKDFRILESDMEQATTTVEFCSKDYHKFISYESQAPDEVDKIITFLKSENNLGKEFKKGYFIKNYTKFAKRREQFRKEFEKILDMAKDVAIQDGYFLSIRPNSSNNSICCALTKLENNSLSYYVKPVDELIQNIEDSKLSKISNEPNNNYNNDLTNNTDNTDNDVIF